MKNPTAGVLWGVAAAFSYSVSAIVGKDLIDSLGASSLLLWRFGAAALVFGAALVLWRRRGGPDPLDVPRARMLAIGVLYGVMVFIGFKAIEHLDVSVYIVVVYLYPAFVVAASSLLGFFRASAFVWLSLAVVMVGILLTVPELFGGVGDVSLFGVGLAVLQAVLMAAFMIISSRVVPASVDGVVQSAWNVLGGALVIAPIAVVDGVRLPDGGLRYAEVALFALVSTVIANVTFFRSMRHIAPGVLAMIMTAEVAFDIVWAVLFLGESVNGWKLLGATVVVGGVLLAQWVTLRDARAAAQLEPEWSASAPVP